MIKVLFIHSMRRRHPIKLEVCALRGFAGPCQAPGGKRSNGTFAPPKVGGRADARRGERSDGERSDVGEAKPTGVY